LGKSNQSVVYAGRMMEVVVLTTFFVTVECYRIASWFAKDVLKVDVTKQTMITIMIFNFLIDCLVGFQLIISLIIIDY